MKQQWRLSTGCGCSDFHGVVGVGGRKCTAEAGFGYRVQEQRHDFPVLPPFCASVVSFSCSPPPSVSLPRPASDKHGVKAVHSWICWLFNSTFRHYIKLFCRTSVTEPTPTYAPINDDQPSTSSPTQIQDSSLTQPHGHEYCQFFPTSPSHPTLASKAPPWNEITMLPNQIQRTTDVP